MCALKEYEIIGAINSRPIRVESARSRRIYPGRIFSLVVIPADELVILADRLEIFREYSRIPDRRASVMKYQSGNARRVPRGAFAFELSHPIEFLSLFSLRWRTALFPARLLALPRACSGMSLPVSPARRGLLPAE